MNTALATQQTNMNEQSLILPNKCEALLMKLNEFKVNNLNARDQFKVNNLKARDLGHCKVLSRKTDILFTHLCWNKLGVSSGQLQKLEQQDINELAALVHQQSRATALIHTGILVCIPVIGWIILLMSLGQVGYQLGYADYNSWKNMRYYWWYKRMKNRYSLDFEPSLKNKQNDN